MKHVIAYIAVGSNIAPDKHVPESLMRLRKQVDVTRVSSFYRTAPVQRHLQDDYANGVFQITTDIPARKLKFDVLRAVESALGRVRTADKHAPRTIDLDLILYGTSVIDEPGLVVPDPDIPKRMFIAVPLLELDPDIVIPGSKTRLRDSISAKHISDLTPDTHLTRLLAEIFRHAPNGS